MTYMTKEAIRLILRGNRTNGYADLYGTTSLICDLYARIEKLEERCKSADYEVEDIDTGQTLGDIGVTGIRADEPLILFGRKK